MKIFLTGAGGMLGTDLAAAFQNETILGVGLNAPARLSIPFEIMDLSDRARTLTTVQSFRPDVIVHTAAMTQVDLCETEKDQANRSNVEVTRYLVEAANAVGALLIYFSTDYVFNGKKESPYTEEDWPEPISYYGKTKLLGERAITDVCHRYYIFRISWLFGVYGRCFPQSILEAAARSSEIRVVDDQKGCPTYSKDLAVALKDFLMRQGTTKHSTENQIYHLTNTGITSWFEYAKLILKLSGKENIPVIPMSSKELNRPAPRPRNSVLSLDKSRNTLGLELRPWEDALNDYLKERKRITG